MILTHWSLPRARPQPCTPPNPSFPTAPHHTREPVTSITPSVPALVIPLPHAHTWDQGTDTELPETQSRAGPKQLALTTGGWRFSCRSLETGQPYL